MSDSTAATTKQSIIGRGAPSLGYDFALLGLDAREARVEAIRRAAVATASRVQQSFTSNPQEMSELLSDVATSTYRLLDPRKRGRIVERIQLSVPSEADLELNRLSRRPLLQIDSIESATDAPLRPRLATENSATQGQRARKSGKSTLGTTAIEKRSSGKFSIGDIASSLLFVLTCSAAFAGL